MTRRAAHPDREVGSSGDSTPPCAICAHRGAQPRTVLHLTHGASVWLCEVHGDDAYLLADGGRRFASDVSAMWRAAGAFTLQRAAALSAHERRIADRDRMPRRPGSYAWRVVRQTAERRFASGEDPRIVIEEILASLGNEPAVAPSIRTMRRWYAEARWLAPSDTHESTAFTDRPRLRPEPRPL